MSFIAVTQVREYLALNTSPTDSKYSDTTIGSNIRSAINVLEHVTHRRLEPVTATLKFTTNGAPYMTITGLRTASSVTLAGTNLTAEPSNWLIPDAKQSGV